MDQLTALLYVLVFDLKSKEYLEAAELLQKDILTEKVKDYLKSYFNLNVNRLSHGQIIWLPKLLECNPGSVLQEKVLKLVMDASYNHHAFNLALIKQLLSIVNGPIKHKNCSPQTEIFILIILVQSLLNSYSLFLTDDVLNAIFDQKGSFTVKPNSAKLDIIKLFNSYLLHNNPTLRLQLKSLLAEYSLTIPLESMMCITVPELKQQTGNSSIIVAGPTGAGKSTLINSLLGHSLKITINEKTGYSFIDVEPSQVKKPQATIGQTSLSCTIYPQGYQGDNKITFYDLPGGNDNRNYYKDRNFQVMASHALYLTAQMSKEITALIIVIPFFLFSDTRFDYKQFQNMMKGLTFSCQNLPVVFIFSHILPTLNHKPNLKKIIQARIRQIQNELEKDNKDFFDHKKNEQRLLELNLQLKSLQASKISSLSDRCEKLKKLRILKSKIYSLSVENNTKKLFKALSENTENIFLFRKDEKLFAEDKVALLNHLSALQKRKTAFPLDEILVDTTTKEFDRFSGWIFSASEEMYPILYQLSELAKYINLLKLIIEQLGNNFSSHRPKLLKELENKELDNKIINLNEEVKKISNAAPIEYAIQDLMLCEEIPTCIDDMPIDHIEISALKVNEEIIFPKTTEQKDQKYLQKEGKIKGVPYKHYAKDNLFSISEGKDGGILRSDNWSLPKIKSKIKYLVHPTRFVELMNECLTLNLLKNQYKYTRGWNEKIRNIIIADDTPVILTQLTKLLSEANEAFAQMQISFQKNSVLAETLYELIQLYDANERYPILRDAFTNKYRECRLNAQVDVKTSDAKTQVSAQGIFSQGTKEANPPKPPVSPILLDKKTCAL